MTLQRLYSIQKQKKVFNGINLADLNENPDDYELIWRYPSTDKRQDYDFISSYYSPDYQPQLCKRFLPSLAVNNAIVESWSKNNYKTIDVSLDAINYHSRKIGIEYKYRMDLGDIKADSTVLSYKLSKEERFKKLFRNIKCKEFLKNSVNCAESIVNNSSQLQYIKLVNQNQDLYPARVNTCEKLRKLYNLPFRSSGYPTELKPLRKASIISHISEESEPYLYLDELFKSSTNIRNCQTRSVAKKSMAKVDENKEKSEKSKYVFHFYTKRIKRRKHRRKAVEVKRIESDLSDSGNEADQTDTEKTKQFFFKKPRIPRLKMPKIISSTKIENEYTKTISKLFYLFV